MSYLFSILHRVSDFSLKVHIAPAIERDVVNHVAGDGATASHLPASVPCFKAAIAFTDVRGHFIYTLRCTLVKYSQHSNIS
jgi:hypothetical protein